VGGKRICTRSGTGFYLKSQGKYLVVRKNGFFNLYVAMATFLNFFRPSRIHLSESRLFFSFHFSISKTAFIPPFSRRIFLDIVRTM
jgi:hypothetical protein